MNRSNKVKISDSTRKKKKKERKKERKMLAVQIKLYKELCDLYKLPNIAKVKELRWLP